MSAPPSDSNPEATALEVGDAAPREPRPDPGEPSASGPSQRSNPSSGSGAPPEASEVASDRPTASSAPPSGDAGPSGAAGASPSSQRQDPPSGPPKSASRARSVDPLVGSVLDGKYRIHEKIGEGGMGSVYTATQTSIDRKVAIKVLLGKLADDEIAVKRFEQEARAISKMQHPNTVTIYDFGTARTSTGEERLYIVMEFLRGRTLTQLLRREGSLEGSRASRILRQVCSSLADAHGAGIIHRDLKPDNIFLTELGGETDWVKVLDFGVAKLADSEAAGTLTQTGMIFGTPKYMSPEQAEGKTIDYRADIYALGVVLYELIAGKPPFAADTPVALLLKHITDEPPPFSQFRDEPIDPRLEAIVRKALEKHPDRRQQQVTELAAELEAYERATTGPQGIPTDAHRGPSAVMPGALTGGSPGLPTEVVPGTQPGSSITPAGLPRPDHVPTGLGDALPPGSGQTAAAPPGMALRPTEPGVTRPEALSPRAAGLSSELSGIRAPAPPARTPVWLLGGLGVGVVLAGVLAAVLVGRPSAPIVQPVEPNAPAREGRAEATTAVGAEVSPPDEPADPGEPSGRSSGDRPRPGPAPRPSETRPSEARAKGSPAAAEAGPAKVAVRLSSEPEGAVVRLRGRQVGVTPATIEIAPDAGAGPLTFVFSKRGFRRARVRAEVEAGAEVHARLRRRSATSSPVRTCPDGSPPPCKVEETDPLDLRVDDLK